MSACPAGSCCNALRARRPRRRALLCDFSGLLLEPDEADFAQLGASGYVAEVAAQLQAMQAAPGDEAQAAVASEALRLLLRMQRGSGRRRRAMKLSRIVLEEFRKFRQPLALDGLQPGLNLFVGPNEAGKSTVAAAIRAAFRALQHQDGRRSGAARRIRRTAQRGAGVQPRGA